MHTMVETIDVADVERVGRLLAEMIARLDDYFMDGIREDMMRPHKSVGNGAEQNAAKDGNA